MPYLQLNDKRYPLRVGETRVGAGPGVEVSVPGPAQPPVQAIVDLTRESQVSIRRAASLAVVRVNGVLLGAEPTPLIHGDKIEFGPVGAAGAAELFFGDDRKGGSTQFIAAMNLPDIQKLRSPAPGKATSATGGRVISLVDGREYTIPSSGLTFGRDAGCDVVIPSSEVSRRHAEIVPGDVGYVLSDTSTNGIFVNGERIEAMQVLGRGDVVRIGTEEFRFYADALPIASAPPPVPAMAAAPAAASGAGAAAVAGTGVGGAGGRGEPITGPSGRTGGTSTRPPLATLEVTGESGAGMVKIVMNGRHEAKKVTIEPRLLGEDLEMLEDLVAAAINDASRKIEERSKEKYADLMSGMNLPPGMKLPF